MSEMETARAKSFEKINKDYNRALRRLAKTPIEFETRKISDFNSGLGPGSMDGIAHLIETEDGGTLVSFTVLIHFTAYGLARPVVGEGLTCYTGTFVDRTIPASIIVKNVKMGMRRKLYFLPCVEMPSFSAKEVLKKKTDWNLLLDNLNNDESLRSLLKKLPTEKTIYGIDERYQAGKDKSWNYGLNDEDDNYHTLCQIVPLGNKTLIATRHMVSDPKRIEHAVRAINRIRDHIVNFGLDGFSRGRIPQPWAKDVIELIRHYSASRERPLTDISSEPIARHEVAPQTTGPVDTESQAACPSCSVRIHEGEKYCRSCGADLVPKLGDNLCPRCGATTYSGMKFCGECGISLIQGEAASCPKCGADTKPIMIYCGECGHPLKA